jgi:hypothetical protein
MDELDPDVESRLALLAAENESLRGRLAGRGRSALPASGTTDAPPPVLRKGSSMRIYGLHAANELGYRLRG